MFLDRNKVKIINNICISQAIVIPLFILIFTHPLNQGHVSVIFLSVSLGFLISGLVKLYYGMTKDDTESEKNTRLRSAPNLQENRTQLETKSELKLDKPKPINTLSLESENLFRRIIENVESGIFMANTDGIIFYSNFALVKILGYKNTQELVSLDVNAELSDKDNKSYNISKIMKEEGVIKDHEIKCLRKDADEVSLLLKCNYIYDDQGNPVCIEGLVVDITEKKILEEYVLHEKRKLELILNFDEKIDSIKNYNELVNFIVDETVLILEAQRCSLMLLDEETKELTIEAAKGLNEEIVKATKINLGEPICGIVAKKREAVLVKNIEYDKSFRRAKGPTYLGRSFVIVPIEVGDKLLGVINVADKHAVLQSEKPFDEIDKKILCAIAGKIAVAIENVKLYKELSDLTVTDPMTQIYNYRRFSESLDYEIKRLKRGDNQLCISMIDLDKFKQYNDTYGHLEGDELLRKLGEIYKTNLRDTDLICRYAGDEFCAILPETDLSGAKNALEKLRKIVEEYPFKMQVTLSIGIAQYKSGMTKKDLILKADKALYEAKHSGRNRICISE